MKSKIKKVGIDKNEIYAALILGLFVFSIYAAFPAKTFYWDGIIYAQFIEDSKSFGAHLFHANHLIYNFLGYSAYKIAKVLDPEIRALFVLQAVTIFFGGLCASVFFLIAKRLFKSFYVGITATGIFAFSAGWWRYASDADVYIISTFFLLVAFLSILPETKARPFLTAFAHTAAMLFHELAIFFFPVAVLGIYFQTAEREKRDRIAEVFKYAVSAFLLTFITYCVGFYLQSGGFNIRDFVVWMISFAPSAGVQRSFSEVVNSNFRGLYKIFIDGSSNLFQRGIVNYVLLTIFLGSVLLFVVKTARNLKEVKSFFRVIAEKKSYRQPVVFLCLVWIIPNLIFLIFFSPENLFYRLFYFPAMVILLAAIFFSAAGELKTRRRRLALLTLSFCLYNFLFYVQPNSVVRENTQISAALKAKDIWSNKTVIFYDNAALDEANEANNRLIRYFNTSVAWQPLNFITLKEFENRTSELRKSGESVWLDASAIKYFSANRQTTEWLSGNSVENGALSIPKYNIRFIEIIPKTFEGEKSKF